MFTPAGRLGGYVILIVLLHFGHLIVFPLDGKSSTSTVPAVSGALSEIITEQYGHSIYCSTISCMLADFIIVCSPLFLIYSIIFLSSLSRKKCNYLHFI